MVFLYFKIGLLLTAIYRPLIYKYNIADFGFADVIGSLLAVPSSCFVGWSLKNYSNQVKNYHIIISTIIYSVVWEFFGYIEIYGTYDIKDIYAAFLGGVFTFILKKLV